MALDPTGPIEPDRILDRTFTTVRRGVDPAEVERYLLQIANQMRATATRIRELERELEDQRLHRPEVVDPIDSTNLNKLLGEETARVLDAAQSAAAEIRARAEENVARMLREAREESTRLREEAELLMAKRTEEAEAASIQFRERQAIERHIAENEAAAIVADAKQQGRDILAEAQRYKEKMLEELGRRREALREQIEQLQESRDRLAAAYDVVRDTVAVATEELRVALPDERIAAEVAAVRAAEAEAAATVTPITTVEDLEPPAVATVPPVAPVPPSAPADTAAPHLTVVPPVEEPAARKEPAVRKEPAARDESVAPVTELPVAKAERKPEPEPRPEPEVVPAPVPVPSAPARPSTPAEGRHSSSVRVVRTGKAADVFARLREEGAAEAAGRTEERTGAEDGKDSKPEKPSNGGKKADTRKTATATPTEDDAAARTTDAAEAVAVEASAEPVADDSEFIATRNAAVESIASAVTRRIKRELSDEQNELLATVGTMKGNITAIALLPTPESQLERYEDIALSALADAAAAGAEIAPLRGRGAPHSSIGDLASSLASSIVAPLRERLERAITEASGDRDDLTKRIRSTFREWKGQRVDDAVEFAVLAACNRGMLDRLPRTAKVRWVLAATDDPSPDCEDNSLADPVTVGGKFPTGHVAPPLHPGCHCAVLPVRG